MTIHSKYDERIKALTARPNRFDDLINEIVAEALLPKLISWLKKGGEDLTNDKDYLDSVISNVVEAIDTDDDGYKIARNLDSNHGWDADSDLVDILENVVFLRGDVEREIGRRWGEQTGVKTYVIGTTVKVKEEAVRRFADWVKKDTVYLINSVYPDFRYAIREPDQKNNFPVMRHEDLDLVEEPAKPTESL